jgi:putative transcriptional regulator
MVDLSQDPAVVRRRVDLVRLFSGYAGWGAGQLEGELQEGAWFVFEATEADALTPQPEDLWQQVFRRQPDDLKWMGFFPDDPQQN